MMAFIHGSFANLPNVIHYSLTCVVYLDKKLVPTTCRLPLLKREPSTVMHNVQVTTSNMTTSASPLATSSTCSASIIWTVKMPPKGSSTTCSHCGKQLPTRVKLYRHIRNHNIKLQGGLTCNFPLCGKVLQTIWSLHAHMNTHTGKMPYKCRHCDASFRTGHGRKYHELRNHTHEKPFACRFCDARFVARQACQVHELRVHIKDPKFQCSYCDKKFILKEKWVEHERVHRGEKPVQRTSSQNMYSSIINIK